MDSLVLIPGTQTKLLVIRPRPDFFSETTTAGRSFSSTSAAVKTSEQKRNWPVFNKRFNKI